VRLDGSHLCYCTNIHAGETWSEIRRNLGRYLPEVKRRVSADAPFGVGLRLSAVAAETLSAPDTLEEFARFLREQGLYVFTINGFPYGPFHGTRVKEGVYRPDWRDEARLEYTNRLADLLAALLPPDAGTAGSVSTVPGAYRTDAATTADAARIAEMLLRHVAHLVGIERTTGRRIVLALEPEPCCLLETVDETVAFFRRHLHSSAAAARLAQLAGLGVGEALEALHGHLGVCLDLCHAAVEFEDPAGAFAALDGAGIAIAKMQVTAGLRIPRVGTDAVAALRALGDDVYLHQVVERGSDGLRRYPDIELACDAARWRRGDCEWRVHFHVPVFLPELDGFASTQEFVRNALELHAQRPRTPHLEVETYTWSVIPEHLRGMSIEEAISRELAWVGGVLR
jgi:sugar phosphate isomerase/epimerase